MRIENRSGEDARRVLIGMLVDDVVCGRVAARWPKDGEGLFAAGWCNTVAAWCVLYHGRYGTAPGRAIEGMFRAWCEKGRDKDTVAIIEKFLKSLSKEYEARRHEINPQYLTDLAGTHFNRVAVARHAEAMQGHLDAGDVARAVELANSFGRVELGSNAYTDPMSDVAAFQRAYTAHTEPLIEYPGALGDFFRRALVRDAFVAVMSKEKGKKSYWLLDFVWRGMLARRKVAYFECGDLSEEQVYQRWGVRAAAWPDTAKIINVPKKIYREEEQEIACVEFEQRKFDKPITWQRAIAACKKVLEKKTKTNTPLVRLSCHPNGTVGVGDIRNRLRDWEREGWVPDIVVIDYADILVPPGGYTESRHQTNAVWQQLRGLSQATHTLVITATQADAGSYGAHTLSRKNFSEDKRKYAHVTAMLGINETPEEVELGVQRLNWLVTRAFSSSERRCVHVAGCADIARASICSTF